MSAPMKMFIYLIFIVFITNNFVSLEVSTDLGSDDKSTFVDNDLLLTVADQLVVQHDDDDLRMEYEMEEQMKSNKDWEELTVPSLEDPNDMEDFQVFVDDLIGLKQSRAVTFRDLFVHYPQSPAISSRMHLSRLNFTYDAARNGTEKPRKITCIPRNITTDGNITEPMVVQLVNSSSLLAQLSQTNTTSCAVVLFFAPWCVFCAKVAPHFNALARAFPQLHVLAIDAIHFSSLNGRFGTISVPNILIFHNTKAVARFNSTTRTLESMVHFVANVTGLQPNATVTILESDFIGPLSSEPTQPIDYLLILSWAFVILFSVLMFQRSRTGKQIVHMLATFGRDQQAHHHID